MNTVADELINDLQDFMFNEENIKSYYKIREDYLNQCKYQKEQDKVIENKIVENNIKNNNNTENNIKNGGNKTFYFPNQQDSLFWCYYIITNGDTKYEMLQHKNFLLAKQMKIELVEKIRKHKDVVKMHKFDTLSGIESNLANDNTMNSKTFCTLCAIENINIFYIRKNTYFELIMNDTDVVYIVKEFAEPKSQYAGFKYGFQILTKEGVNTLKDGLYKIESIQKPIKAESAYTVKDLHDICSKLGIELNNNETNKRKTKKELYESIIQYF